MKVKITEEILEFIREQPLTLIGAGLTVGDTIEQVRPQLAWSKDKCFVFPTVDEGRFFLDEEFSAFIKKKFPEFFI